MTTLTVPGIDEKAAAELATRLQDRLNALIDLSLTLKHVHWNVVGENFIAVHEMLDPQVDAVREMADDVAERIATLGGEPMGTPGFVAENRTWSDYDLGRATVVDHLMKLDGAYTGVIADHRQTALRFEDLDLATQDMLIGQLQKLDQFQWFIRAHLQNADGEIPTRA